VPPETRASPRGNPINVHHTPRPGLSDSKCHPHDDPRPAWSNRLPAPGKGGSQSDAMQLSVIIPAFNEERLIGETLGHVQAAMATLARRNWTTELIVCDNNSTDHTAELARAAGATVVFEPVNQIARARNRGAAAAAGDWLVFVDADSQPSPALFEDMADQIETSRCVAGGATVRMDCDHKLARRATRLWNGISRTFRWLAGSFIFCEAAAFRAIGGFSNELFASEEIDISRRLKKFARARGKRLVILHRHPLLTSARKLRLYTLREYLGFLARTVLSRGRTLRDRGACFAWYDGRR
jgi:glycosyltransferase involved in cell wall biosynthesis